MSGEPKTLWVCLECGQTWRDTTKLIPSGGGYGHSLGHDLCGEVVEYVRVVARDEAAELSPVGDRLTAYNELLTEWQGRKRTYNKYAASHPTHLREAMRQAVEAGLPLLGDAIQSLVWQDAIASNRAIQLGEHYTVALKDARDEAAELRAAINELLASGGAHGIERRLQLIENGKGQRDRLEAAYARVCALAAPEGQP